MDHSPPGSTVHGDSPSKHTGMGCHTLLQGIFPTQGSDPGLPHCKWILYYPSHQGSPRIPEWAAYPFSRGPFWPRDRTGVSCIAGGFFTSWATKEAQYSLPAELPGRVKVKSLSHVQLFETPRTVAYRLLHPWDFPARILEWVAISFSRRSSQPRDWTWVSRTVGKCFTIWATTEEVVKATVKRRWDLETEHLRLNFSYSNW